MTRQQPKASDLVGRMREVTLRQRQEPETGPTLAPEAPAPSNGKRKVRVTLDLSPDQHRFLKRFAFDAETDSIAVMRVLLRLLETDPALADRVRARLEPRSSG